MTANLDKNLSGCECQSDSTIQGASRGAEKRRGKINQSGGSQRVEGRKNLKQKENKRSREVFSTIEGVYSRT